MSSMRPLRWVAITSFSVVACAAAKTRNPSDPERATNAHVTESASRRATLRVDPAPGPKHFQGVWLEVENGKRFVIDYWARSLWRGFDGSEVIVKGDCYEPFGEAINATHFRVDEMKFAMPMPGRAPYLTIG